MTKGEPYAAIGAGEQQALSVLGRIYRLPSLDVHETAMLAFYVLAQVKDLDFYCGGRTDVALIRNNRLDVIPAPLAAEINTGILDYSRVVESNVFRDVLGARPVVSGPKDQEVRERIAGFVVRLRESCTFGLAKPSVKKRATRPASRRTKRGQ